MTIPAMWGAKGQDGEGPVHTQARVVHQTGFRSGGLVFWEPSYGDGGCLEVFDQEITC